MTSEEGIAEIDAARWVEDEFHEFHIEVTDSNGEPVHAAIRLRPHYCDRGHIQLLVNGNLNLDEADSFPRYFFSFEEADTHTRTFLKWRLWKHRMHPHVLKVPNAQSTSYNAFFPEQTSTGSGDDAGQGSGGCSLEGKA